MLSLDEIKMVHIEASTKCNSHCPMCSRFTSDGFVNPQLTETNLTFDTFVKLFTPKFTSQLDHVYFSGAYGDPCINIDLPDFVQYLIDYGCKTVNIDTNGGHRTTDWWAKFADKKVKINFAIDGTDNETQQKYRMGVDYDKALNNMKAFIDAGGKAQWNFIVFKHNEHQVEQARELAANIGADFRIKITGRFGNYKDFKVFKRGEHVFTLEPPVNEKYRHDKIGTAEHSIVTVPFNINDYSYLNDYAISCKSKQNKELYLGAEGHLVPCCYIGTIVHDRPQTQHFNSMFNSDDFNLTKHNIEEIVNLYNKIQQGWDSTIQENRLMTCAMSCGSNPVHTRYIK